MCEKCNDTGIELVSISLPDGYGGEDVTEESRPCSECS